MMKKMILSILSLVMMFSFCTTNTFALEDSNYNVLSEETIKIADRYIEKEDELIVINQNELRNIIGVDDFNNVMANVNFCNQLIKQNVIGIKENGTLYVERETELTIQGGNLNATRLYWWGWHRYNDNASTKKMVSEFRKQTSYSNSWVAEMIFGSLAAIPGGFILATIPTLVGNSLKSFANELESKNKGYGTIIAANWVVVGSNIKSQTINTK